MSDDWKPETVDLIRSIAIGFEALADAMERNDDILGSLAGENLVTNLPMLPKHIRDLLLENLSDEAAAGIEADARYLAETL